MKHDPDIGDRVIASTRGAYRRYLWVDTITRIHKTGNFTLADHPGQFRIGWSQPASAKKIGVTVVEILTPELEESFRRQTLADSLRSLTYRPTWISSLSTHQIEQILQIMSEGK